MNYGAILLVLLAVILVALGFNGTYNDVWYTFFGTQLHDMSGGGSTEGGFSDTVTPSTPTVPPDIFNPSNIQIPNVQFPSGIANNTGSGPVIFQPQPISPGQINWKGFFGNP